jgi:ADP-ribose pyrophosphatase YjhB (NUDIX family)
MIDNISVEHHIQKYILSILMYQREARFRDLRPPRTDTNLFSYHLKLLQKNNFVEKSDEGYRLSSKGLAYVDRVSSDKFVIRTQPKIITMLVIQNSDGDILLQKRRKQPYTDTWTLPYGKIHIDDRTVADAARREADEKLDLKDQPVEHAGDCYIRVYDNDEIISSTLVHVFRFNCDYVVTNDWLMWVRPHKLAQYDLAPAVEEIAARTFFRDPHFFEEFTVSL